MATATRQALKIGPYEIGERLGRGGAAVVFKSTDTVTGQQVALKILKAQWANNDRCRVRFAREAFALRTLDHPGVPKFIELRRYKGTLVLVQEFIEGRTLEDIVRKEGAIYGQRCIPWFVELLDILTHIHSKGIIHRDLKPQNIMITANGPKILDFGLAQLTGASRLTLPGRTVGTPHYLAQEQARGMGADTRTDIYSLGVSMYRTLTGELPFDHRDKRDLMRAILVDQPVPMNDQWPTVDNDLQVIVMRAMEKNPAQRFQTPSDLSSALEAWQSVAWLDSLDTLERVSKVPEKKGSKSSTSIFHRWLLKMTGH